MQSSLVLKCKESVSIADGVHKGKIIKVEKALHGDYEYVDIYVALEDAQLDGKPFEIKYSTPANLSEASKLGKLLAKFKPIKAGEQYDLVTMLIATPVSLMTQQEKAKDGNVYSRIVEGSLKPLQ